MAHQQRISLSFYHGATPSPAASALHFATSVYLLTLCPPPFSPQPVWRLPTVSYLHQGSINYTMVLAFLKVSGAFPSYQPSHHSLYPTGFTVSLIRIHLYGCRSKMCPSTSWVFKVTGSWKCCCWPTVRRLGLTGRHSSPRRNLEGCVSLPESSLLCVLAAMEWAILLHQTLQPLLRDRQFWTETISQNKFLFYDVGIQYCVLVTKILLFPVPLQWLYFKDILLCTSVDLKFVKNF